MFYRHSYYLILLLLAVLSFTLKFGLSNLLPTHDAWLLRGDWAQHYQSWEYFRQLPWQFPLGTLTGYFYPVQTSIGFTDSIPILALFFKSIRFLLPETFQYIGIWLLLCFFLQNVFAYKLVGLVCKNNPVYRWLGTLILSASTVLLFRLGHPALCAHWLILASFYYYLSDLTGIQKVQRSLVLLVLVSFIHPYLVLVVVVLFAALLVKVYAIEKSVSRELLLKNALLAIPCVFIPWYLTGFFSFGDGGSAQAGGFGLYSANLNNFINSFGQSNVFKQLATGTEGQYEGFAYLGAGILLLLVYLFTLNKPSLNWRKSAFLPLVVVALLLYVFSLSSQIYFYNIVVVDLKTDGLYNKFGQVFQSSGRFAWVLFYLINLFAIKKLAETHTPNKASLVLAVVLLVQVFDIAPIFNPMVQEKGAYESPFDKKTLNAAFQGITSVCLTTPYQTTYVTDNDYVSWLQEAAIRHLPITIGRLSRYDNEMLKHIVDSVKTTLAAGEIKPGTLYIGTDSDARFFGPCLKQISTCAAFDRGFNLFKTANTVTQKSMQNQLQKGNYLSVAFLDRISVNVMTNGVVSETVSGTGNTLLYKDWLVSYVNDSVAVISQENKFVLLQKGETIYLPLTENNSICGFRDNEYFELTRTKRNPLEQYPTKMSLLSYLNLFSGLTVVIAAQDEATANLPAEVRQFISDRGGSISKLGFRGSYAAVLANDMPLTESLDNQGAVALTFRFNNGKELLVKSAGLDFGNTSSIQLNSTEYAKKSRGFNLAVFDSEGRCIHTANADTFSNDLVKEE